jgi:fatty-acyl-CoA synthase
MYRAELRNEDMNESAVRDRSVTEPDGRCTYRYRITGPDDIAHVETFAPELLRPGNTIHGCLSAIAAEQPEKDAVIYVEEPDFLEPRQRVTYAELVMSIEAAACLFSATAGEQRSVVGVMMPMLPEGLIGTWGAAAAGIGVPINPFLQRESLLSILGTTRATALLTTPDIWESKVPGGLDYLKQAIPSLKRVFLVGGSGLDDDFVTQMQRYRGSGMPPGIDDDPRRDCLIMPTGGTTGTPKLVRMSHAGQLTIAWNVGSLMGPQADGVTAHGMPNFHCGGTISLGLRTLLFGQTLLTLTAQGFRSRLAVEKFWDIAKHYRVTSLLATPTTALALLNDTKSDPVGHCVYDFHCGGSALPMDLVRAFHERFGVWLRENWGMTEVHGTVTGHPNDGQQPRVGSAGRALPNYRILAVELDESNRVTRICEPGERGALIIGGPSISAGFLNAALDADFHVTGVGDGLLWGNSGDLGTVDPEGWVWVFGRAKDVIIRGGHNIDPKEIEDALALHPAVHLAAAVGQPSQSKGELPIVYLQPKDKALVTVDELMDFCRDRVQEKAAVPVEVIILDEMPVTAVGKISKPMLRVDALVRAVERTVGHVTGPQVACRVEVDKSGRRQLVEVTVGSGGKNMVERIREELLGYEFATQVKVSDRPDR